MAQDSAIEWTDHTFNPWIGCTKVGPGCDHCYAEALMDTRRGKVEWGGERIITKSTWAQPLRWQRAAAAFHAEHGRRQRVFCASLADVFDNHRSILPEWRIALGKLIVSCPDLEWLLLTKRIGNALNFLIEMFPDGVPRNVRVGATVVNQEEWDRDWRKVRQVKVACHLKPFLSMEPLLGRVNLETAGFDWHRWVGWVIVGGESGHGARLADPYGVDSLREQCSRHQVPFLFKQWGAWAPVTGKGQVGDIMVKRDNQFITEGITMRRMKKKDAGRTLRGRTYTEFPA